MQNEKTSIFRNLRKVCQEIWRVNPVYFFVTIFNSVISNILPAISLVVLQSILNTVQAPNIVIELVFRLVLLYVLIEILQTVLTNLITHFNTKFSLEFNLQIKSRILTHAAELNLKDYENSETYDSIQRAQYMNEGHILTFYSMFVQLGGFCIKLLSYFTILSVLGNWIIGVALIIPIIQFFAQKKLNLEEVKIIQHRTEDDRHALYFSQLIANGINFKELKLYNLFDYFISRYSEIVRHFNKQDINLSKKRQIQLTLFSLLDEIITGFLFAYIIYLGILQKIMIGNIISYTRAIIEVKSGVQNIFSVSAQIQRECLLLNQLFTFFDITPTGNLQKNNTNLIQINKIESIELVHVSYKYCPEQEYVLKDISLKITTDELFAILGENGSGKTTLIKIIVGFYHDYEGEIYVNGYNMKNIDLPCYMSKIGALFQDFSKYEATLRENIGYGNLQILYNDKILKDTCREYNLDDIVGTKEDIDIQLGSWFQNGRQLSIGQWQKIALTRACVKDADMYILDEPNAALDIIAEQWLAKKYKLLFNGKIGFVIAHRFHHFIQSADHIIVLKNGSIVEEGTHNSLLDRRGLYATMYHLQTNGSE